MSGQVKIWSACVLSAGLIGGAGLRAADKIELKGSTAVELPKPARNLDEGSRFKFDTSNGLESGGFLPPPSGGANPLDRKLKEMMDRKKNWIFVNPYDQKMDDRTMEVLEKDKPGSKSLMDHELLKSDEKSAMEKFVEEKETRRKNADNSSPNSPDNRNEMQDGNSNSQTANFFGDAKKDDKQAVALSFGSDNSVFKERESSLDSGFQKRMERSPVEGNSLGQSRFADAPKIDRDESLRQQQESRDSDFTKILQGRGALGAASPTAEGRLDAAFNPSLGANRGDLGGASRRPDPLGNRINFGSANRGSSLSGLPSNLPNGAGPEIGDVGSRIGAGTPSFLPGGSSISGAPAGPSLAPRPFVHELPRRKF